MLTSSGLCNNSLSLYTDADYAGDVDTRRSTTGFVFILFEEIKFSSEDLEGAGHARKKRHPKSLRRCINCPPGFSSNRQRLFPAIAMGFLLPS